MRASTRPRDHDDTDVIASVNEAIQRLADLSATCAQRHAATLDDIIRSLANLSAACAARKARRQAHGRKAINARWQQHRERLAEKAERSRPPSAA